MRNTASKTHEWIIFPSVAGTGWQGAVLKALLAPVYKPIDSPSVRSVSILISKHLWSTSASLPLLTINRTELQRGRSVFLQDLQRNEDKGKGVTCKWKIKIL